jgi:hypothetical protein
MNIQTIWENGAFRPLVPLAIKHAFVTIQVPDDEVADNLLVTQEAGSRPTYSLPPEVVELAKAMEERLDRIRNAPLPDDTDLPPLSQKQLDRIEAFALRDEIRGNR